MIKTHTATGLKYLCYTKSEGEYYSNYKGSGKYWKNHLKKHGSGITTELIFECETKEEFKKYATKKSIEFNVVKSTEWANLKIEEGDGGDTVSNKMWVTDGKCDKYVFKDSIIEEGWKKGRSNCIFNDSKKQREFGMMADAAERGKKIKEAWDAGKCDHRDNTNIGSKNKDPEVKAKISKALTGIKRSEETKEKIRASKSKNKA